MVKRHLKTLAKVLQRAADANIEFSDLVHLLEQLGFEFRVSGSHHVFFKPGVEEQLNLQREGHLAKAYQVRQVRNIILRYSLA